MPPLTTETIWAILNDTLDDATTIALVWHCLGYRSTETGWDTSQVAAEWKADYPEPPDFIASRPATVKLTRSIPAENKQLLKEQLGFQGYKVGELVPRKTRRATIANWLLSYLRSHPQADAQPNSQPDSQSDFQLKSRPDSQPD
jgi:Domain of unknown function (DUF1823)